MTNENIDLNADGSFPAPTLLLNRKSYDTYRRMVQERSSDPWYRETLKNRDSLISESRHQDELLEVAKGREPDGSGMKGTSFVKVREATLKAREVNERLSVVQRELDDYRMFTAKAAGQAALIRDELERRAGTLITYERDAIGDLVAAGDYEIGSPEWHRERASGIGGSDVPCIMRVDDKYSSSDYRAVLLAKLGMSEPESSENDLRNDLRTAIGRGNAWEEYIRQTFADRNPEERVAFCKTSWKGSGKLSYRHANFDGLLLDKDGNADGIVEIKTGSRSDKWGNEDDGFAAAPDNYRKQVLWYAMNAKVRRGVIVAILDDYDYREYWFDLDKDGSLQEEIEEIKKETDAFWNLIQEKKAELARGVDTITTHRKGFTKTLNMKREAEHLSLYTGEDENLAYERVKEAFKKIKRPGIAYTKEEIQDTLTSLYAQYDPEKRVGRPFIGIDLETNHAAVKRGRIIETGIVRLNNDGSLETLYSSRHGLSESVMEGLGVGDTELHRITGESVKGLPPFEDEGTQRTILKLLKTGILVAHNAGFEDRFLTVNLKGYAEARDSGEIRIFDTKEIATRFMLNGESNSLESFTEENGVPYVGAHAAWRDTFMMMKALLNFQKVLHRNGSFVPTGISDSVRESDSHDAEVWEQNTR